MTKAIIEFNLENFDDRDEYQRMMSATKVYCVLHSLSEYLRRLVKYQELPDEVDNMVREIQKEFYETLEDYNINLDDLK